MANKYWVGGTGTWSTSNTANWSLTSGGAGGAAVPTTSDVAIFDSASNVSGSGASYIVTRTATAAVVGISMANPSAGTLTFTGTSAIGITTSGLSISGTINWTNTGTITFTGTTSTLNTGTTTITSPVTFNGSTRVFTLSGSFSTTSTITLTTGTLALNNLTLTGNIFSCSGTSARTISFGTSGKISLTGAGTVWTSATSTNMTTTGTQVVELTFNGATARTITPGTLTEADSISFSIIAGTGSVTITAGAIRDLNFTGFSGTLSSSTGALTIYGSLTLSASMTQSSTNNISFNSTSTGKTITSAGKALRNVLFNGTGGEWTLQDALSIGVYTLTLTSGSLNTNNFSVTAGSISSSGTNTRSLTLGTSTVTLSSATPIDFTTATNLTIATGGSSTIVVTNSAPVFNTNNKYFGIVSFSSTTITTATIGNFGVYSGFSFPAKTTDGVSNIVLTGNIGVTSGSISITGGAGNRRYSISSNTSYSTSVTTRSINLSVDSITATLSDIDFRDTQINCTEVPSKTYSGTRLGNIGNNTNIVFDTTKNVYWSGLTGSQSWSANGWANASGGTPSTDYFPLVQDVAIIDQSSVANILLNTSGYVIGTIDASSRTSALSITTSVDVGIYGNITLGSGITISAGGSSLLIYGYSSPQTLTQNGAVINTQVYIGSYSTITLGGALSMSTTLSIQKGALYTSGYNISCTDIVQGTGAYIYLNSSVVTLSGSTPINITNTAQFNSETSIINCTSGTVTFNGSGATFYNVGFTATTPTSCTITGNNTYNNLAFSPSTVIGYSSTITFDSGQTINGVLTCSPATSGARRKKFSSSVAGTTVPISAASVSLADTDFSGIVASGASIPWTGDRITTRMYKLNSNITESASKTVYWSFSGTANWSANTWAATSGGTPNALLFPLPQDIAIFDNNSGGTLTATIDQNWHIGSIDISARTTTGVIIAFGSTTTYFYGDIIFGNFGGAQSTSPTVNLIGGSGVTQSIMYGPPGTWTIDSTGGTVTLLANKSMSSLSLTNGTLDLNDKTIVLLNFYSNNSNTRSINFGTSGIIQLNGGSGTIWDTSTTTGLTISGTSNVYCTGILEASKTINAGAPSDESNSISFNISVSSISPANNSVVFGANNRVRNLNFTGFNGTWTNAAIVIRGDLTLSSSMTVGSGASGVVFAPISANSTIISNGKTLDFPITIQGTYTTILGSSLLLGNNRTLSLVSGGMDLNGYTLTTTTFNTAVSGTKNITFNGGTLAITGSGTSAFNNNVPTGFTTIAGSGTGKINLTSASAKTFVGGGSTFNCALNQGGLGALTITGSNTFNNITNTVQPASVLFTAGTTTTVDGFGLSGTAGNLITIGSVTAANHTLSKSGGVVSTSYCTISRSTAVGGATWNASTTRGNVDGGSNSGWSFVDLILKIAHRFLAFF